MEKKFKLSKHAIKFDGKILHKIEALTDIPKYNVKVGDLGGYVEKEENLSQVGICWISDDAKVYGNAKVVENAIVCEHARVFDNAMIRHYAKVSGKATINGNAQVYHESWVFDNAIVSDNVQIYDKAWVFENAEISGDIAIGGESCVYGNIDLYHGVIRSDALVCNSKNFMYVDAFSHQITFFTTADKIHVIENNTMWDLDNWENKRSSHSEQLKILADMVKNYFVLRTKTPYPAKKFIKKNHHIKEIYVKDVEE